LCTLSFFSNLRDTIMSKTGIVLLFVVHVTESHDYAHIGQFCSEKKFEEIPCLRDFCAEINVQANVWATTNGSVHEKLFKM
jgi:hypothetical protein